MKIVVLEQGSNEILKKEHLHAIKKIDPEAKVQILDKNLPETANELKEAEIVIGQAGDIQKISSVPNLKWFHITSAGANALSKEIINSDVLITNSSGVHPIPISEHVLGLMLMLARGLHKAIKVQVEEKTWVRDVNLYQPSELAGKNLLVVGMGRIGERVATLGQAFEMNVTGIVRNPTSHKTNILLKSNQDLASELKNADYVVNCLPSTPETVGLFDKKMLNIFKKGSFFINIGRGDTVDEKELIKALKSGTIKGAGLDVFEKEPLPDASPLWKMDNVIITPHYSGLNPHYFDRVIDIFCENLAAFLNKKSLPNLVDKKLGY
jgi:phosphoglycerate dehydrogenase-like enzyme